MTALRLGSFELRLYTVNIDTTYVYDLAGMLHDSEVYEEEEEEEDDPLEVTQPSS